MQHLKYKVNKEYRE